jgi:hypothetical protein
LSPRIPRMMYEGAIYYQDGKAWTLRRWGKELRWVRVPDHDAQPDESHSALHVLDLLSRNRQRGR